MHELSIVRSVLASAFECSAAHDHRSIVRVTLQVGANRHVVPELLRFAFDAAAKDTQAEGADLCWSELPLIVECRKCASRFEPKDVFWECPDCGGFDACLLQGDELILESVELAED